MKEFYIFRDINIRTLYMATERILVLDLTGPEPVTSYRDIEVRRPLADITHQRRGRRRARSVEENHDSDNEENVSSSTRNRLRGRRQRRRRATETPSLDLQEGIGIKTSNPWIQHVKSFAKQHGITYWKALKSPQCKSSYK